MGQTIKFKCPLGYRLEGLPSMTCQYNGIYWIYLGSLYMNVLKHICM